MAHDILVSDFCVWLSCVVSASNALEDTGLSVSFCLLSFFLFAVVVTAVATAQNKRD